MYFSMNNNIYSTKSPKNPLSCTSFSLFSLYLFTLIILSLEDIIVCVSRFIQTVSMLELWVQILAKILFGKIFTANKLPSDVPAAITLSSRICKLTHYNLLVLVMYFFWFAWKEAKKCTNLYMNEFITKDQYLEFGSSYIKEYKCSNLLNKNT